MALINPKWLKTKGYLHITGQIDVVKNSPKLLSKIKSPKYIASHAFYPLLHSIIKERKFKRIPGTETRSHSYIDDKGTCHLSVKERPLHYASHFDALIFGYYAELVQEKYEERVKQCPGLSDCIIAYRKLPGDLDGKNKSTIDFAYEVFEEIKERAITNGECYVLTFDIKSFFSSLNHDFLKNAWAGLFDSKKLSSDHYNVFKAATQFSYIFIDELRNGINGYNEKQLAKIRNRSGFNAFFESPKDFREQIKSGNVRIHKYPFREKETGTPIGIPQGLPISAILANLYLLSFDIKILSEIVTKLGCYYRRYSDDIILICSKENVDSVENFVINSMRESKVELSLNKTEKFIFKNQFVRSDYSKIESIKVLDSQFITGSPLRYLGFEFNGQKILIKSSNLSKFYRRMIYSVKSKARRAKKMTRGSEKPVIFRRQLYKLYTTRPLRETKVRVNWKKIKKNEFGNYTLLTIPKTKLLRSNYLSYIDRASDIMQEPAIKKQIRNHKKIFNEAISKHLK